MYNFKSARTGLLIATWMRLQSVTLRMSRGSTPRKSHAYEAFHPGHTGGDDGPIANAFALRHADKKAPPGFVPVIEEIKRVSALRLVN
jgi:hypothetical protein